jgi:hypothetical protein
MPFKKLMCLAVVLWLIVSVTSAFDPDQLLISSNADWVIANGDDTAMITARVSSGGSPLGGQEVSFSVDPKLGSIRPQRVVTDSSGVAIAVFQVNRTSGTAAVHAAAGSLNQSVDVKIDHDLPYRIFSIDYTPEVTAGETTPITVHLSDRWGNPVDDRRSPESVWFTVGSQTGTAGFWDGATYVEALARTTDSAGNVTMLLRTDQIAGENIVFIDPPPAAPDAYITVYGQATGLPSGISMYVRPDNDPYPCLPADGASTFSLVVTLTDRSGNPAGGQDIWINTSLAGEECLLRTNAQGEVGFLYGPKETTGMVTITATAVDNTSVTASKAVEFMHTEPVDMLLSASPQSLPSLDVNPSVTSTIHAKVIDEKGNPVAGEVVDFTISQIETGAFHQTQPPVLIAGPATTDENGHAVVGFRPGAFTTDPGDSGYSEMASGRCTVTATWGSLTRNIVLTWKNFPYLSVEAGVTPETVQVGETVDVTVRVRGDGWALRPDPIDAVLVMDRSGSMENNRDVTDENGVPITRLEAAKRSAKTFITRMDDGNDRLGMVSYDFEIYRSALNPGVTIDAPLGSRFSDIDDSIDHLDPNNGATATRAALKCAIDHMVANPNTDPGAVRAVILMTDGNWNNAGSPVAHGTGWPTYDVGYTFSTSANFLEDHNYRYYNGLGGTLTGSPQQCLDGEFTEQNMSVYAKNHGIRIYAITFAFDPDERVASTYRSLSESTGGFYRHAPNTQDLTNIYAEIAGELREEAGVDTQMNLNFDTVDVNGNAVPGGGVFDYVYEPGISTLVHSYNSTADIIPPYSFDQTDDWSDDRNLHYEIGTIRLGQVWETTFRFQVLQDGNINIFDGSDAIMFNGGSDILYLPDTYITAVPAFNNTGIDFGTLHISNLQCTGSEPVLEFVPVAWDLHYTGFSTVTEELSYSRDGGYTWICFDTHLVDNTTMHDSARLDVRDLPAGFYYIRVRAEAPDAPSDQALIAVSVRPQEKVYIRLE